MTYDQVNNLFGWLHDIIMRLELFFHEIQYWFENDSWMLRLNKMVTDSNGLDDEEEPTK